MSFIIALATDLVAITIIAYALYFRRHRRRDLLLAYTALNVGVLAVTMTLSSVEVGLGLGMGLFGILSIIRLRSDQITQQEIAYYFISLALGLLAGLHPDPWWVTPALAALVITVMYVVDHPNLGRHMQRYTLTLDRAYTDPVAMHAHLRDLLGVGTLRAEVLEVDLIRDFTVVDVRYDAAPATIAPPAPMVTSTPPTQQAHPAPVASVSAQQQWAPRAGARR